MKRPSRLSANKLVLCFVAGITGIFCASASTGLEQMTSRIQDAKAELEDLEIRKSEVIAISQLSKDLEASAAEVRVLEAKMAEKMAALEAVRSKWVTAERKRAEGESLGTLVLRSGTEYPGAFITQVTDVGLGIRTESGTKRIPAEDLPQALQDRFQFKADVALAQMRAEQAALARHEAEVDSVLGATSSAAPSAASAAPSFVDDPFAGGGSTDLTLAGPGGLDPFGGGPGFPDPTNGNPLPPPAPGNPAGGTPAPANPAAAPKKDKGRVTARPKSYNGGLKLVEFVGHANCAARVVIHGAASGEGFFDIAPYVRTEREIWCYSNYTVELVSADGVKLDEEKTRKKTDLGRSELER